MRTTIDIQKDLLKRIRDQAHKQGLSFKEYLNTLLRRGLEAPMRRPAEPYHCPSIAMGAPAAGFDLDHALRLAGELEDDESARDLRLRK